MEKIIGKLIKSTEPLTSTVIIDSYTKAASKAFDLVFNGKSKFYPWEKPIMPKKDFSVGVIYGASGSGKSTLLKEFGNEEILTWDPNKAIVSHFDSEDDALNKLGAVGLNSIPTWHKPYHVLSNGEKFRAELARRVKDNAVIDEYTSVVDRNVAKAASVALSRYVKQVGIKGLVLATCHEDVLDWLQPDWVINTNTGEIYDGFFFVRPQINLEIYSTDRSTWEMFKEHHYLRDDIHKSARCFVALWDGVLVGFNAVIAMPNGYLKKAWRGTRLVVLPDYQGMGIGVRFSDTIGQIHLDEGKRYFSRTASPRMGWYREHSSLWRPTSKNQKLRTDIKHMNIFKNHYADNERVCFSHEYIGPIKS